MRFNTLYRGSATEAAAELDGGDRTELVTLRELQVALVNALQCIARLERQVDALEHTRDVDLEARAYALYRRDEPPWTGMPCNFGQLPEVLQARYLAEARAELPTFLRPQAQ